MGSTHPSCNSLTLSAAIRFKLPQYNMIRIGVSVYGLFPSEATKKEIELKPPSRSLSRIVGVQYAKNR